MYLLINTVTEPHFCQLRNDDLVIAEAYWNVRREDSMRIYSFWKEHRCALSWVGWGCGPAGYSSLRAAAAVVDAIALAQGVSVRSAPVTALAMALFGQLQAVTAVAFQSFGDKLFVVQKEHSEALAHTTYAELTKSQKQALTVVSFLPEAKRANFAQPVIVSPSNVAKALFVALGHQPDAPSSEPFYYYPAVELAP